MEVFVFRGVFGMFIVFSGGFGVRVVGKLEKE